MPRVHTSQRQKNKPFKGKNKSAKKAQKVASKRTKPIAKPTTKRSKNRRGQLVHDAKNKKIK